MDPRFHGGRLSRGPTRGAVYELVRRALVRLDYGQRRKPQPGGQPGSVRVDTAHQGDHDGARGVYHINMVDDVTQFQFVGSAGTPGERLATDLAELPGDAGPQPLVCPVQS